MSDDGYITNCIINLAKKDTGKALFVQRGDKVTPYLDGYAIIPVEEYIGLKSRIAELEALYSAATDVMKERGNRMLELEAELARMTSLLDKQFGTPCEQIRMAELEAQNALQAEAIVSFTAQIKALELEALEERASYEAERQRLREALPPLSSKDTEVHDDLRKWADAIEQALEKEI